MLTAKWCLILLFPLTLIAADTTSFEAYPAEHPFTSVPAKPRLKSADLDNHFKSELLEDGLVPNFAGHFRFVVYTCGSSCSAAAVVDSITGKVYDKMPFANIVLPRTPDDEPYSFRTDSRLLVVQGYFDEDFPGKNRDCSRRHYEWSGTSFKLRHKVLLTCQK